MGKQVTTVAGIAGFGSLLAGVGLPKVIEGLPFWVNIALFAAGAVLIAAAFISHLLARKAEGDSGAFSQSTSGPHSPTFGVVHGNVHVGPPAPPATQERKSPHGYDINKLNAGLERALSGIRAGTAATCPEMPMWRAVEYVRNVIGEDDENGCQPETRRQLRQAALDGRIEIWGRREISPAHLKAERTASDVWTRIAREYWEDHQLNSMATGSLWDGHDHTWREGDISRGERFWSLRVRQGEIEKEWPSTMGKASMKQPKKPLPDVPLNELLARVYRKLGPAPVNPEERTRFRRRVDLHIADTVKLHGLTVWARFADFPLDIINPYDWKHALLDHVKGELKIPNDWHTNTYTDLHFNRVEIEEHWPKEARDEQA